MIAAIIIFLTLSAICTLVLCAACVLAGRSQMQAEAEAEDEDGTPQNFYRNAMTNRNEMQKIDYKLSRL